MIYYWTIFDKEMCNTIEVFHITV